MKPIKDYRQEIVDCSDELEKLNTELADIGDAEEEVITPPVPHEFETIVESLDEDRANPTIVLSANARKHIFTIIKNCGEEEISWLGSVKQEGSVYTIDKIFLFDQEVSITSTEISSESIGKFYNDLIKQKKTDLLNSILFWGHVHPGNDVTPSVQDEEQMKLFSHNKYFIRGIFGRQGRAVFDFYDYTTNVRITDTPWYIDEPVDAALEKAVQKEIRKKVKKSDELPWIGSTHVHPPAYFGGNHFQPFPRAISVMPERHNLRIPGKHG